MGTYHWYDSPENLLLASLSAGSGAGAGVGGQSSAVFARAAAPDPTSSGFDVTSDLAITGSAFTVDASAGFVDNYGCPALRLAEAGTYAIHYRVEYSGSATPGTINTVTALVVISDDNASNIAPFAQGLHSQLTTDQPMAPSMTLTVFLPVGAHIDFRAHTEGTDELVQQQYAFVQQVLKA